MEWYNKKINFFQGLNKFKQMKNYLLLFGIILVFLISACSQQLDSVQPAPQPKAVVEPADESSEEPIQAGMPVPGQEDVEEMVVEPVSNAKEFDMTARQWEFTPSTIRVKEGDRVKLNIKSMDVTHGFAISEFGVNERLEPGKTTTVEFTADKKGEYIFFCSVPCGAGHRDMKGKLIVEQK